MKRILCVLLTVILLPAFAFAEEALTARFVFDLTQAGDYAAVYALAEDGLRKNVSEERLRSIFSSLTDAFGQVTGFGEESTVLAEPYRIASLPVHYENAGIALHITWLGNQIAGIHYSMLDEAPDDQETTPVGILEEIIRVGDPALEGYLTLPANVSEPVPAVVFLHGSGPNDRDESLGSTKLFRDLAYGMAQAGIAAARYDKRTYVYGAFYPEEKTREITVREESIDDVIAAARLLRSDSRIDPERIFLAGHSLGAMLAPRAAWENPGLFAGIVMLSGSPKTLADITISQNQALVDAMPPLEKIAGTMQIAWMKQDWQNLLNGTAEEAKERTIFGVPAYYFWEMAQYDTAAILRELAIPALIINGGSDFQVSGPDGIDAWRAAELPESVQLSYYPELNHLLMAPQAPETIRGTVQEYGIPCHAAEEVLDEITAFILN